MLIFLTADRKLEMDEKKYDETLSEQKRKDILLEQDRIRKWVEEDEPLPIKMSCTLSQHIVSKKEHEEE